MTKSVTANTSWFIVHIWIQKNIKFLLVVKRNKNIIIFLSKFPGPLCMYCGEFWETVTVIEICRKHCDLEGQGTMKWFHNKIEQNWRQLMWQSCVAWSERLWNNNHPWFGRSWLTGVHFFRRMAYCFPTSMGGANPENKWSKQVDTGPQYPSTGLRSRVTWPSISGSSHTRFPLTYSPRGHSLSQHTSKDRDATMSWGERAAYALSKGWACKWSPWEGPKSPVQEKDPGERPVFYLTNGREENMGHMCPVAGTQGPLGCLCRTLCCKASCQGSSSPF